MAIPPAKEIVRSTVEQIKGGGLFRLGAFTLNSGRKSQFKIDCDFLTDDDWDALAWLVANRVPYFGSVEGVPRGGVKLASALLPYVTSGQTLITDDVITTGASMERRRAGRNCLGVVIFARGPVPAWVTPLFSLDKRFWDG
jgi:orotate phosphoribosyltransferase